MLVDRNEVDEKGEIKSQSLTIKFEFLLMKAIQESNEKINLLESKISILDKIN